MLVGRAIDNRAPNYLKQAIGWCCALVAFVGIAMIALVSPLKKALQTETASDADFVMLNQLYRTQSLAPFRARVTILFLSASTQVLAQSAGNSVSLQYGTVSSVGVVQAAAKHTEYI